MERFCRGDSPPCITGEPMTKVPRHFASFYEMPQTNSNPDSVYFVRIANTKVCQQFASSTCLLHMWTGLYQSSESRRQGLTVTAFPVEQLKLSQEESDTRIILHCLYTSRNLSDGDLTTMVTQTQTFCFVIAYCELFIVYCDNMPNNPLLFDTGTSNNRRLISINCIASAFGDDIVRALLGLHAFTGSYCTRVFVRKGKWGALC